MDLRKNILSGLTVFVLLVIVSCRQESVEDIKETEVDDSVQFSEVEMDYNVAVTFINDYVKRDKKTDYVDWLKRNENVSKGFLDAVVILEREARLKEPEIGLGFDPVLNAQDCPDTFRLKSSDGVFVTLQGIDWPEFELLVRLKIEEGRTVIDGVGVVNLQVQKSVSSCQSSSLDFLALHEKQLQIDFFSKLDSIQKIQHPNKNEDSLIFNDLTSYYLNRFLADINKDSLSTNNSFEKEYHFGIAPKGYTDPSMCKDKIRLYFDEEFCSFRLIIDNTFLVDPDWCAESNVIYTFQIINKKIIDFSRQIAG